MKKADKAELDTLFETVVDLFNRRCWSCKQPYSPDVAFTFHHRDYVKNEKIYSDFKTPDGKPDRLNYYRYLIPIIKKNPDRFRLLHHKHHWMAENLARCKPKLMDNTVALAKEIQRRKGLRD